VNGRPRIARPRLSTLRTRISHDARRCRRLNIRLLNNRTKTAKEKTEKDAVGGYDVAALLVAALGVLLCVLRHADHLGDTNGVESSECICDAGIGKVAVPLVLDAGDLAVLVENVDLAGDGGLFTDALDLVQGGHVQLDGIAGGGNAVVFALDFGEGSLETIPLRLKLLPALCDGDRVTEDGIVLPELQLGKRGSASEEVQYRRHNSPLLVAELDTSGGLDGAFELKLAGLSGRRHSGLLLCGRRCAAVTGCEVTCCGL
jgi:hypothetical protein